MGFVIDHVGEQQRQDDRDGRNRQGVDQRIDQRHFKFPVRSKYLSKILHADPFDAAQAGQEVPLGKREQERYDHRNGHQNDEDDHSGRHKQPACTVFLLRPFRNFSHRYSLSLVVLPLSTGKPRPLWGGRGFERAPGAGQSASSMAAWALLWSSAMASSAVISPLMT